MELLDEVQRLHHLRQVLARNAEPVGAAQADAHEDRVELLLQLPDGDLPAHLDAGPDLHAQAP
jgi:hypothetical protein